MSAGAGPPQILSAQEHQHPQHNDNAQLHCSHEHEEGRGVIQDGARVVGLAPDRAVGFAAAIDHTVTRNPNLAMSGEGCPHDL